MLDVSLNKSVYTHDKENNMNERFEEDKRKIQKGSKKEALLVIKERYDELENLRWHLRSLQGSQDRNETKLVFVSEEYDERYNEFDELLALFC